MKETLKAKIGRDKDFPPRVAEIEFLTRVLEGTIYDCLKYEFHEESAADGKEYIPIHKRRPSARYNIARMVVSDSISLLFGEGRFPAIVTDDAAHAKILEDLIAETRLVEIMREAAHWGSIGSSAIIMKVLKRRIFFDALKTQYLTPKYDPEEPDTLLSVTEKYKIIGTDLVDAGYDVARDKLKATFWFQRVWDTNAETWYVPWTRTEGLEENFVPLIDKERTVIHNLGFVPIVWMKNLPGGNGIDGTCTFKPAIDNQIQIEYQLSQAGRGLKYSSDPLLLIKEPAGVDGEINRTSANAMVLSDQGDAKLLEISGDASKAVIDYVKILREQALEQVHGNRSSPDKMALAQSGKALEMLLMSLVWLSGKLRTSYGDLGLLQLMQMVVRVKTKIPDLKLKNGAMGDLPADLKITLKWPPWFAPTSHDMLEDATRVVTLTNAAIMSQKTAIINIAEETGVTDVKAEMADIAGDTKAKDARAVALNAAVTAQTYPLPA